METWFIIVVSLCISALIKSFFNLLFSLSSSYNKKKLPPGPFIFPIIGKFLWLRKSFSEIEPVLKDLRQKYGPIITLHIGSRPVILVGNHSLAHKALVQNGAVFSDRPKALATSKIINSNQHNVSSAAYGPNWRTLRRNLTSEILHPSRVKNYSAARNWVLAILINRLNKSRSESKSVIVVDHFQYAMFCLLVLMCFGDKLEEKQIKEIERVQRELLLSFDRFNILNFWPTIGKILFRNRWKELIRLRQNREAVLIPLIRARSVEVALKKQQRKEEYGGGVVAYVDTLMDLELPEEKRKLNDDEMVSLCGEFLNAGTDTSSTALQWIMASLVKYPDVQAKLYEEVTGVAGSPPPRPPSDEEVGLTVIKEEDLQRMPYLKAVVLEGLRRHPPAHFVLPHSVTEDTELEGFVVPKNATINFMVAEMGWDSEVWDDPKEFKPERFLTSTIVNGNGGNGSGADKEAVVGGEAGGFDITGSREIRMMPFGAGRRICPASGLALLHLEYFVANLIWYFKWTAGDEGDVDLSEKRAFTIVMKNPLRVHLSPRTK
ncbi:cytochrome P450 89A2-like [Cornus florida]|uniref:cytochrome P450 89A2-like n=1 Tax=Cornus florida TaxID=4283 RepID=UPI00289E8C58|nr:cytochrome P450 89A2-like [Cornus florida]